MYIFQGINLKSEIFSQETENLVSQQNGSSDEQSAVSEQNDSSDELK